MVPRDVPTHEYSKLFAIASRGCANYRETVWGGEAVVHATCVRTCIVRNGSPNELHHWLYGPHCTTGASIHSSVVAVPRVGAWTHVHLDSLGLYDAAWKLCWPQAIKRGGWEVRRGAYSSCLPNKVIPSLVRKIPTGSIPCREEEEENQNL